MVDPLKVFWVLTNSSYIGKLFLETLLMGFFSMNKNNNMATLTVCVCVCLAVCVGTATPQSPQKLRDI